MPSTPENVQRVEIMYEAFEEFGSSPPAVPELGMFTRHVTPKMEVTKKFLNWS